MTRSWARIPITKMRDWHNIANSRLLGDTIMLSEDDWHQPSLLPGWSRAHVATHLARDADAIYLVITRISLGWDLGSEDERFRELELGADRPGLSVQEDLDYTAGRLDRTFASSVDWNRPIRIGGEPFPLGYATLVRLHEVLAHHLDLRLGFTPDQIDPETARWLLAFVVQRLKRTRLPAVGIRSDSGLSAAVGSGRPVTSAQGSDARLWAWLSGRIGPDWVRDAGGVEFGLLS